MINIPNMRTMDNSAKIRGFIIIGNPMNTKILPTKKNKILMVPSPNNIDIILKRIPMIIKINPLGTVVIVFQIDSIFLFIFFMFWFFIINY